MLPGRQLSKHHTSDQAPHLHPQGPPPSHIPISMWHLMASHPYTQPSSDLHASEGIPATLSNCTPPPQGTEFTGQGDVPTAGSVPLPNVSSRSSLPKKPSWPPALRPECRLHRQAVHPGPGQPKGSCCVSAQSLLYARSCHSRRCLAVWEGAEGGRGRRCDTLGLRDRGRCFP